MIPIPLGMAMARSSLRLRLWLVAAVPRPRHEALACLLDRALERARHRLAVPDARRRAEEAADLLELRDRQVARREQEREIALQVEVGVARWRSRVAMPVRDLGLVGRGQAVLRRRSRESRRSRAVGSARGARAVTRRTRGSRVAPSAPPRAGRSTRPSSRSFAKYACLVRAAVLARRSSSEPRISFTPVGERIERERGAPRPRGCSCVSSDRSMSSVSSIGE